jgi:hypothetical protein
VAGAVSVDEGVNWFRLSFMRDVVHRIDASEPVTKALDAIVQEDVNQLPGTGGGANRWDHLA